MTWFTASLIVGIKRIDMPDGPTLAYENVVLIEAGTAEEAFHKAREYGGSHVSINDDLTLDDKPAIQTFVGIRKLVKVGHPDAVELDQDNPMCGTEATYSLFELESDDALVLLASGKEVSLRYIE